VSADHEREARILGRLCGAGRLQGDIESLTDRQIGQLMFDVVWDALELVSPAMSISIEATYRLLRSPAGARAELEVLNDLDNLPDCPRCGESMLHYIGIGEPDYLRCTDCGFKRPELGGTERR
jgi:hypothetical protein